VSDRLHAEGRVADAVLTASDDFESSAVLRVLCLAQLGRFDDALVSLLGILSEHVVVAASDDATTRVAALEDVFLAFVNDFCTTLAHWRAVCAALFVAILDKEKEAKVSEQQAKAKASFCRTLYTLVLGSLVATLSFASFSSLLPENVRSCFISFLPLPICSHTSLSLSSSLLSSHREASSFTFLSWSEVLRAMCPSAVDAGSSRATFLKRKSTSANGTGGTPDGLPNIRTSTLVLLMRYQVQEKQGYLWYSF
jgi:hypothetical protein